MLKQRTEWEDFLLDPTKPARYFAKPSSGAPTNAVQIEDEVLIKFIRKLANKAISPKYLINMFDLTFGGYNDFVSGQLGALLKNLNRERTFELEIQGPSVRGRINWGRTITSRDSKRIMNFQHVVSRTRHVTDLPENRLVKLFLKVISDDVDSLMQVFGTRAVPSCLVELKGKCDSAISNFSLREVSSISFASPNMRERALRQRNPSYGNAARLLEKRMTVRSNLDANRLEALMKFIQVGWFAPVSDDDLYELYILFLLMDIIENDLGYGEPIEYGLLDPKRDHVAKFGVGGDEIFIFFNQSPTTAFSAKSEYINVTRAWSGISSSSRRPDILLLVKGSNGRTKKVLIEVKRTDDGPYTRDSIYKVFGYLHDFRTMWADTTPPYAILVFPDHIRPTSEVVGFELLLASSTYRADFANSISAALLNY